MALHERGEFWYGDSAADIRELMLTHDHDGDAITVFEDAVCECGGTAFLLMLDDDYAEATLFCRDCGVQYLLHISEEDGPYEGDPDGDAEECGCPCSPDAATYYEITVGASLYDESEDVNWLHIGCRCVACGLTAFYASWHRIEMPYRRVFARLKNKLDG